MDAKMKDVAEEKSKGYFEQNDSELNEYKDGQMDSMKTFRGRLYKCNTCTWNHHHGSWLNE